MPGIGLILLAAGTSSRLGRPKQLLDIGGRSLISHTAQTALGSRCRPVTVVLGAAADEIRHNIALLPVNIIFCHDYRRGLGASIQAGVASVETDAVLLMLTDQPLIISEDLNRLVDEFENHGGIVASSYAETFGTPVIFGREFFPELLALEDRSGAKSVLQKYASRIRHVPVPNAALDLDTEEDYQRLLGTFVHPALPKE